MHGFRLAPAAVFNYYRLLLNTVTKDEKSKKNPDKHLTPLPTGISLLVIFKSKPYFWDGMSNPLFWLANSDLQSPNVLYDLSSSQNY